MNRAPLGTRRPGRRTDFLVVIPARIASERFPGKVLADLGGLPVVEWCRRAAAGACIGPVVIATDDAAVERALRPYGAEVVRTSRDCPSGSDRVWEAARLARLCARHRATSCATCARRKTKPYAAPFVMNLQGDEPMISSRTVRRVADTLRRNPWADVATAVVPVRRPREAADPNVVKVAMGAAGRCLYFSRSPIPFPRRPPEAPAGRSAGAATSRGDAGPAHGGNGSFSRESRPGYWRHIGIYAYRRRALERFVGLPPSPLELRESLEQLRALEAGMAIVSAVADDDAVAIDTPEDLARARRLIARRKVPGINFRN